MTPQGTPTPVRRDQIPPQATHLPHAGPSLPNRATSPVNLPRPQLRGDHAMLLIYIFDFSFCA